MSISLVEVSPAESVVICPAMVAPIPQDLIEVHAYYKWLQRRNASGQTIHGFDMLDWLEAEREVSALWKSLTVADLVMFAELFTSGKCQASQEAIRERAYYKAMQKSASGESSCEYEQLWREAEVEERKIVFAEAFLTFCTRRQQVAVFDPDR